MGTDEMRFFPQAKVYFFYASALVIQDGGMWSDRNGW